MALGNLNVWFHSMTFCLKGLCVIVAATQTLYDYIYQRGAIVPITNYDETLITVGDVSQRVVESIRKSTDEWENLVPRHVAHQIKNQRLWGYRPEEVEEKKKLPVVGL